MKTIEEMSRDYQRSDEDDGTTATAFQNGAEWMCKELTRWHDPKEELPPIYDNVMVKYMALDGCEHVAIAWRSAGDAGGYTYAISGTGVAINSRNVIGWREIHE